MDPTCLLTAPAGLPPGFTYNWWELSCHLWRYEYAAAQEDLGLVADAACGLGYGSEMLRCSGHRVKGFDRSPDALAVARHRYARLEFVEQDLDSATFDGFQTLVSFETLEHLENPWGFIKGLSRSVKTILCSAPIVPTVYRNPFHKHDFTEHGFGGLVEFGGFQIVDSHFQSAPTRRNVYMVVKGIR